MILATRSVTPKRPTSDRNRGRLQIGTPAGFRSERVAGFVGIRTRKGERWFCSAREALDAGWRAPLR